MMTLDDAITKALDEATKQLKIEELESELNEWKRWCKEKEQALDDLAKAFSQQQDLIKRLEREVELLRLYGNKDCTAQADEVLKKEDKP